MSMMLDDNVNNVLKISVKSDKDDDGDVVMMSLMF